MEKSSNFSEEEKREESGCEELFVATAKQVSKRSRQEPGS